MVGCLTAQHAHIIVSHKSEACRELGCNLMALLVCINYPYYLQCLPLTGRLFARQLEPMRGHIASVIVLYGRII